MINSNFFKNLQRSFLNIDYSLIKFIFKSTLFMLIFSIIPLTICYGLGLINESNDICKNINSYLYLFIGNLFFAPIIENTLLIILIGFVSIFFDKTAAIVSIATLVFAVAHWFVDPWRIFSGGVGFGVLTYSYLIYSRENFRFRFGLIYVQHMLFNIPTTLIALNCFT